MDKPCQNTADTICSPCSRVPWVKSDYFLASCEGDNVQGPETNLDHMMMSDGSESAQTMNDNGHILSDKNKVNTNEGQNSTNPENEHSDNAILMPLPVKKDESEVAIDLTTPSTHEHSSLDEVKLEAVKLYNNEKENNMKGEIHGLYSQTSASYNEQPTESRLSDNVVSSRSHDGMNSKDMDLLDGTQADAPVETGVTQEGTEPVNMDALSDNTTGKILLYQYCCLLY